MEAEKCANCGSTNIDLIEADNDVGVIGGYHCVDCHHTETDGELNSPDPNITDEQVNDAVDGLCVDPTSSTIAQGAAEKIFSMMFGEFRIDERKYPETVKYFENQLKEIIPIIQSAIDAGTAEWLRVHRTAQANRKELSDDQ